MFKSADHNPDYLKLVQYRNRSNLDARIELHRRFSTNSLGLHTWVFDQLATGLHGRVLEVGCGIGTLWETNMERIPERMQLVLSDFSQGMVEEASKNLTNRVNADFVVVDVQHMPFKDGSLDAVIANHMLYHVPSLDQTIAEIWRVLAPGGLLFATTNGQNHLKELDAIARRFNPRYLKDDSADRFGLENGASIIAQRFPKATLTRFPDSLVVTEAEPLVDYILSMPSGTALGQDKVAEMTKFVEGLVSSTGSITIRKESGIFIASKQ
ncbi:MAG: class I SAM-dependent methyltransferase [Chloroflexi bacterium]|nr:class I SAM-dependent methyltransferase [Chloroflexota bacterium]